MNTARLKILWTSDLYHRWNTAHQQGGDTREGLSKCTTLAISNAWHIAKLELATARINEAKASTLETLKFEICFDVM